MRLDENGGKLAASGRLVGGLCLVLVLLGGCAGLPTVQPWERGRLARWDMQWQPDPLEGAMSEHVLFSKEGSSGRLGAAGGGCGCN